MARERILSLAPGITPPVLKRGTMAQAPRLARNWSSDRSGARSMARIGLAVRTRMDWGEVIDFNKRIG